MEEWHKQCPGHVIGEGNLVYMANNLTPIDIHFSKDFSVLENLRQSKSRMSTLGNHGTNVHTCTSVMCELCQKDRKANPIFVSADKIIVNYSPSKSLPKSVGGSPYAGRSLASWPYSTQDMMDF
eukprot:15366660-Ditylum_brightwellii.AAC.2